jgi:hypothetical protein
MGRYVKHFIESRDIIYPLKLDFLQLYHQHYIEQNQGYEESFSDLEDGNKHALKSTWNIDKRLICWPHNLVKWEYAD